MASAFAARSARTSRSLASHLIAMRGRERLVCIHTCRVQRGVRRGGRGGALPAAEAQGERIATTLAPCTAPWEREREVERVELMRVAAEGEPYLFELVGRVPFPPPNTRRERVRGGGGGGGGPPPRGLWGFFKN
jgi:hypothetical protein